MEKLTLQDLSEKIKDCRVDKRDNYGSNRSILRTFLIQQILINVSNC
jgi:hypothetical protein